MSHSCILAYFCLVDAIMPLETYLVQATRNLYYEFLEVKANNYSSLIGDLYDEFIN